MWPYLKLPHAFQSLLDTACPQALVDGLFPTDLTPDGRFAPGWIVLTRQQVLLLSEGRVAASYGLAEIQASEIDELNGASRLLILTAAGTHTLARASKAYVPELGVLRRALEEARQGRTPVLPERFETAYCPACGSALPERGATCPRCFARRRIARRLLAMARPYRLPLAVLLAATVLGVGLELLRPYLTRLIVDRAINGHRPELLVRYIGILVGSSLVAAVIRMGSDWLTAWVGARVTTDLRSHVHRVLQSIELRFLANRESGEVVSRVMNDTSDLQRFLVDGSTYILVHLLTLIGVLILLFTLDPVLAAVAVLPVPALMIGGRSFMRIVRPRYHRVGSRVAALHSVLGESIRGLKTIKSFAGEGRRTALFDGENEKLFGAQVSAERVFSFFYEGLGWAMALGIAGVWAVGGWRLARDAPGETLTLGTLVAFIGYIWMLYGPLQWFSSAFSFMTRALTAAERIFLVVDGPQEAAVAGAVEPGRLRGEVRFDDVRFSYERGREVIRGITFHIRPGEMIGLVGRSGAGKSTLINLLCRFFDADSGTVLLDGHPIQNLQLESFRRQIGTVLQEPFLFNASIFDNIACAKPEASFEEVMRAAIAAHAHEFIINREDGYDTVVGEGGVQLSGGERQRLAIARAILHDPPILILDEATASVDTETEKAIQEAMQTLVRGRTTLAIAHRLSTLRNAHRLLVIDDGRLAEQGSHDELLSMDGIYAKLVRMQTEITKLRAETEVWRE